ncbi:proto-oncogene tyrosine-protein kinase ROS-like, partial [Formica exsecta]|uniref:proto-oncogene tyrosine-protein kinase ROS-like n=1 Tax=Formica exsecta TaxID=72781 RepID=UPI001143877C
YCLIQPNAYVSVHSVSIGFHGKKNLTSDRSYPDNVSVRNNIDEIPFTNMSEIPESIDSTLRKPTSLRAFVEFYNGFLNKEDDISVTFRWNQFEFTDEVIQGYTVQYWFIKTQKQIQICNDKNISATVLKCTVHNLKPNTTYYFQVRAHTKVGVGPYTNLFNVSTTHENPIPKLLMITGNDIDIWDLDAKINVNLVKDDKIVSVAHSIAEHKIYWSNEERELIILKMNANNISKITKFQNVARDLCIDWIARNLYWTEDDGYKSYNIIKFNLTMWKNGIVKYDKILKVKTELYNRNFLNILPSIGYVNFRYKINKQSINPRE